MWHKIHLSIINQWYYLQVADIGFLIGWVSLTNLNAMKSQPLCVKTEVKNLRIALFNITGYGLL